MLFFHSDTHFIEFGTFGDDDKLILRLCWCTLSSIEVGFPLKVWMENAGICNNPSLTKKVMPRTSLTQLIFEKF